MRKLITLAGILVACVMVNIFPAMAKGWVRVNDKWAYQDESGYFVKCQWVRDGYYRYLIDPYGFMTTGWIEDCDGWYYINPDRSVATNTCMTLDGKTYFFNEKGQMLHDTFMNGYFIGSNGAVVWDKIYDSKEIAEFEEKQKAAESKEYANDGESIWMSGLKSNNGSTDSSDEKIAGGATGGNIFTNGPSSPNGPSNIPDPNRDSDEDTSRKTKKKSSKSKNEDGDSETTAANYSSDPEENHDEFVDEVIRLVNKERKKKNLKELKRNEQLCEFADIRAEELVENFSHTRPDGTRCFTILAGSKYENQGAGENVAKGYGTPELVMRGWMNSSGHRKNILEKDHYQIGVGYYYENGCSYWVQLFADTWV